jgi:GNAT superfamily N-acetyltransferase
MKSCQKQADNLKGIHVNLLLREADPEQDYARAADIINSFERQPITADTLREWDRAIEEDALRRRMVAVDGNYVVGYSAVSRDTWDQTGSYITWIGVDPAHRKHGIGSLLWADVLAFALGNGANELSTEVLDDDPEGLRFAEKRGFSIRRHLFESTIDLKTFDPEPFARVVEDVKAGGIRLFSLAEAGDTREARYKLWEVNYQTYLDDPASNGSFPDFEGINQIFNKGSWFRPDGQLLAADEDQYVGLSAVGYFKEGNSAYNMMTGVIREYRGRKIALALKVMSIRAAQGWGVDIIRTNNDSENAPMLAINQKLGYVSQPGIYRMVKAVESGKWEK